MKGVEDMKNKKYEFNGETIHHRLGTLHQIIATRDIPRHGIKKGDLGGWILKSNSMLSQEGDCWIQSGLLIGSRISGDILMRSGLIVNSTLNDCKGIIDDSELENVLLSSSDCRIQSSTVTSFGEFPLKSTYAGNTFSVINSKIFVQPEKEAHASLYLQSVFLNVTVYDKKPLKRLQSLEWMVLRNLMIEGGELLFGFENEEKYEGGDSLIEGDVANPIILKDTKLMVHHSNLVGNLTISGREFLLSHSLIQEYASLINEMEEGIMVIQSSTIKGFATIEANNPYMMELYIEEQMLDNDYTYRTP